MVLITGDKGFVGSHLTKQLKEYVGYDLVDGFDIRNKYQLETIFENYHIDTVIHLAALAGVRKSKLFPDEYISTNVTGTLNIIDCCKRHNVKHLISISSSSVYGNQEPPNSEESECQPIALYGMTKLMGELLVKNSGVPYTIIRPFSLYGENGRRDQIFYKWLNQIKEGKPITFFGDGSAKRGFTYVGDFVDGLMLVLRNGASNETYNIGCEEVVTMSDILGILKESVEFEIDHQPSPKEDILQNWADISKIKGLGYVPKTRFRDKLKEIIKKEL